MVVLSSVHGHGCYWGYQQCALYERCRSGSVELANTQTQTQTQTQTEEEIETETNRTDKPDGQTGRTDTIRTDETDGQIQTGRTEIQTGRTKRTDRYIPDGQIQTGRTDTKLIHAAPMGIDTQLAGWAMCQNVQPRSPVAP